MKHRGPDTNGIWLDGKISRAADLDDLRTPLLEPSRLALGHSRLSIIGRDAAGQPFLSCDGQLALVHNGEIYNYEKLRSLLLHDHRFRTASDSEVIIHLIEETYEGDLVDAVRKVTALMDGMYALAVTDGEGVVAARDPIGKKPIYFIEHDDVTYFASEKKALWNGEDTPSRLNPGDLLVMNSEETRVTKGFHLQRPQIDIVDFREAVDRYKAMLQRAVKKRLVGLNESVLGVIFSGGIDSVLVAKMLQAEGRNVLCYCTGTSDSGDVMAARNVADDLGLPLRTTIIDETLVEELLPEVIRDMEEAGLLQVEVAIPIYLAARLAAEDNIRVMYTGQAADEIWAGYPWYSDVLKEKGYLRLHEKLWEDLNYLYTDTLEREDKLTMAHSIELRAPYLDRDVINLAMRVSPRLKIQGPLDDQRKRVHRQAAVELGVPAYLAYRLKDPAQSGSGIHGLIQSIVRKATFEHSDNLAQKNLEQDKGSLYRYGEDTYGDEDVRCYLQRIEERVQQQFIPPYLQSEPTPA